MLKSLRSRLAVLVMVLSVSLMSALPAMAQSDTITVDTGAFISEINNWFPMAVSIAAIGVGIAGAFALARFVGRMILDAFNGRMS
jgi:hypothetical protein